MNIHIWTNDSDRGVAVCSKCHNDICAVKDLDDAPRINCPHCHTTCYDVFQLGIFSENIINAMKESQGIVYDEALAVLTETARLYTMYMDYAMTIADRVWAIAQDVLGPDFDLEDPPNDFGEYYVNILDKVVEELKRPHTQKHTSVFRRRK